jgi:putative endonuclease
MHDRNGPSHHDEKPSSEYDERGRLLLGRRGEQLAAEHLRERGWTVLARNVRTRDGEIDLIAADRDALVFIEVKTCRARRGASSLAEEELPLVRLGMRQRARLRRLARAWLARTRDARPASASIRFDAIGVVLDSSGALQRLDHFEDAW